MTTLETTGNPSAISKLRIWIGRITAGLVIAFMLIDSIPKIISNEKNVAGLVGLGYQPHHIPIFGSLGFISIVLFAIPRTEIIGAILLTGYFGGAVATHIRLEHPLFSLILFPVYVAMLAWGSLWIKNDRLRKLILNKN